MSEHRALRIAPESYWRGKDLILTRCREVICQKGLEPQDIKPRYPSWRRELHTRLLREEDHNFGLDSAFKLAAAIGVKVEFHLS